MDILFTVEFIVQEKSDLPISLAQGPKPALKPNAAYLCSFNFIFKLLEMGLSLASLILAVSFDGSGAIICIEIVVALVLVTAISWCVLYAINMNARFPEFFPTLMFGYHLVMCLMMIAATACAAYLWPQFKTSLYPQYLICTFTCAATLLLLLIDTVLNFLWLRGSGQEIVTYPCSPYEAELTI
ncbi:hypothetical protein EB796_023613 [Bugula neritina]|uniref:MARVEL domain-containing protein n=1 Tax=Bugula neritina TaxID=10212 RepID=A0A7J7IW03_BUGNE|nr:hypothetical protein EB796_023613 [Bugula neritina]